MYYNYEEVTLTVKRIELCDMMLACLAARNEANDSGKKWIELHEKLKNILNEFDKKNMPTE